MMYTMKASKPIGQLRKWLAAGSLLLAMTVSSRPALAGDGDLDYDARLEGYKGKKVNLDLGVAQYFLLLGGLGVIAIIVTFKDGKRSDIS